MFAYFALKILVLMAFKLKEMFYHVGLRGNLVNDLIND